MITALLIANRGEIARRIITAASAMGIRTVAVYAQGDAGAPYVREADLAVPLAGRTAAETYLNSGALLAAAAQAGADAVHPGYGFLSERADFARAVTGAGLTWVGPPAGAIEAMGDKLAAKRLMAGVGVPVLPAWEVTGDDLTGLADVPLPVIVKAAAGGGGKGMRVVTGPGSAASSAWQAEAGRAGGARPGNALAGISLAEAVTAAQREAAAAFGDPTVFLERYIPVARHVEVQILADAHGGAVHCFERECSIQRRHQKIIEECPSPAVGEDLRDRMCAAALAAAKTVGYTGTGTVEFVLEPSGDFWFLEMNTRLQVEHPVTEAVTGLDLVREQLLAAQGLPLSVTQADLAVRGHAIEARLYAEDPAAGFLPATGTLLDWCPATSPACRWDSGAEPGSVVGTEFDPMLAKVNAHAPARAEAALRLALALERSRIRGVTTNRDFLVAALRHPQFLAGNTTTVFLEHNAVPPARLPTQAELHTAVIGAALAAQRAHRADAPVLGTLPGGWRHSVMPPERACYRYGTTTLEVSYRSQRDGSFAVRVRELTAQPGVQETWALEPGGVRDGGVLEPGGVRKVGGAPGAGVAGVAGGSPPEGGPERIVAVLGGTDGWIELAEGGLRHRLHIVAGGWHRPGLAGGQRVWVQGPGGDVEFAEVPRFAEKRGDEAVAGALLAPMPGTVLAVQAAPGDTVGAGQLLLTVEAMKMEHRITAPRPGVVGEVRVRAGDQVAAGDLLAVLGEAP